MRLSGVLELPLVWAVCLAVVATGAGCIIHNVRSGTPDGTEEWGYVEVRPKAHMFWWFYCSPERKGDSWPLILWLQGGPGASGVALGNFEEIGPLDTRLHPRRTTWLQKADLLFVDSPVGTGFSYVEKTTLAAQTDAQVTEDFLSFLRVLNSNTSLLKGPVFIVGESYGGKHATLIALALSKSIAAGQLNVNLGGVALGDSWISPVDYVVSWGSLLVDVSRLEPADKDKANSIALKIQQQVGTGHYGEATDSWSQLEDFITASSNNVDFYNFLLDSGSDLVSSATVSPQSMKSGTPGHYIQYLNSKKNSRENETDFDMDKFMNGVIRKKLKIIPPSVTWSGQSDLVFTALQNDFMKDVIDQVDELLSRGINVTIYNGQMVDHLEGIVPRTDLMCISGVSDLCYHWNRVLGSKIEVGRIRGIQLYKSHPNLLQRFTNKGICEIIQESAFRVGIGSRALCTCRSAMCRLADAGYDHSSD